MVIDDKLKTRIEKAFCFISSQSNPLTEAQVNLFKTVHSLIDIGGEEDALVVLYVLEQLNEDLIRDPEFTEVKEEIKNRLTLFFDERVAEIPDPWELL